MKFILLIVFAVSVSAHLKDNAKKIYVGSAINHNQLLSDAQYKTVAAQEFNCLTAEYEFKWAPIQKEKSQSDYGPADQLIEYAHKNGFKVRGHTLLWHQEVPKWVEAFANNKTELANAMVRHVKEEVEHFKGKLYCWDVVNEVLAEDGTIRKSIWSDNFGTQFISDAFRTAGAVDPDIKLYINEYGTEGKNNKSDGLYNLVKQLKSSMVPIHGVGFQAHFESGMVPADLQSNLQRFADLGLDVAITELDLRIKLPVTPEKLAQQAKDYAQVYSACLAVERCVGVTVWGYTDKYSWVPGFFKGYGAANLFDENYKPKPAVAAIEKILK